MNFFSVIALASVAFSFNLLAQDHCEGHLFDHSNRLVQVFDNSSCYENLKACRLAARQTGLRCEKIPMGQPGPRPVPRPNPQPVPEPIPRPQPRPQPPYGRLPVEVERMTDIERAINFVLQDCHVVPNVAGWANQLYVRGQFFGNYDNRQEMELRRSLRDLQARGQCLMKDERILSLQFDPQLINDAIDYSLSRNCHVLPRVSGWANQLYVDGQFSGNFDVNKQDEQMKLRSILAGHLVSGRCQQRSFQERNLLKDPYLIQDFANFQYRGCHVKLNVSGWAHQLYVGHQFSGNFDKNTELRKLQKTLVDLVISRSCVYDPM